MCGSWNQLCWDVWHQLIADIELFNHIICISWIWGMCSIIFHLWTTLLQHSPHLLSSKYLQSVRQLQIEAKSRRYTPWLNPLLNHFPAKCVTFYAGFERQPTYTLLTKQYTHHLGLIWPNQPETTINLINIIYYNYNINNIVKSMVASIWCQRSITRKGNEERQKSLYAWCDLCMI